MRSRRLLAELGPSAVLGGGGYASAPVGLAAAMARIPLVLTEADSHLGLANRLLAPFARRVCLAFPIPGREGGRFRVTGRPIPAPVTDREAARHSFGLPPSEYCVLVYGGSLGSRTINQAALRAFADADFRVLHVAGRRDFDSWSAPARTTTCAPTWTAWARPWRPATWWWHAREARCSRSPLTAAPPS